MTRESSSFRADCCFIYIKGKELSLILDQGQTRRLKTVELDILDEISRVCRENDIEFFLDSGTLLGAERHHGFIPWDDDIDIGMIRADYEKFLRLAPELLGRDYSLETPQGDDIRYSFCKVRRRGTTFIENATLNDRGDDGIWVDIFPFDWIDGTADNIDRKKAEWRKWHRLMLLRVVPRTRHDASLVKKAVRSIVRLPLMIHDKNWYCRKLDGLADSQDPREDSVLTCFHYYSSFPTLSVEDVLPLEIAEFEGEEYPVFHNWEKYLTQVYGDWRQLPPEDERVPHHDVIKLDFGEIFE